MERNRKYREESDPLSKKLNEPQENQITETCYSGGETRTIDFVLLNGKRQNFSYAHYMKAWTEQENGMQVIKIFFTADLVTIKGYCLDKIYDHLCKMDLKTVRANYERYYQEVNKDNEPFVIEIRIEKHKKEDSSHKNM